MTEEERKRNSPIITNKMVKKRQRSKLDTD